ncbi:phosphate signaling complex protein PhoU [Candidatus Liberibacter solanacearum]|uniref:Phosphate-specific transport system accessory protein PhoU n=1 Tax=Candidatus Liberibacter solanacearum TaxID=556287 RepID=A0A1V2N8L2_9HYPH|nr:phosphate signaling complex protein PhoU [Candidatus Liberibacter solanacearum]ONI59812.1 phosphate transport system regulatory protein PhoU [Candidatus Liberibacter solanacearum]ONI60042.1 phosphate transport system regulatory protein PhoU [Candidatus Liberibacter solanacearum]
MSCHILSAYDEELDFLSHRIVEMGVISRRMVDSSVRAFIEGDAVLAHKVIDNDIVLDQLERDIGDKAIITIAKRQPMASDLREIVGSIRIAADLERIGDLAKNTAQRVLALQMFGVPRKLVLAIEPLADLSLEQISEILEVYGNRSIEKTQLICSRDGELDAMHTSLFRKLLTYMMEDSRNIILCTHLLFCSKNIERIGDHVTNIAETIHYMTTGIQLHIERLRKEDCE